MGICFFCPNGHPLNVKAELAGKIGFCPKCRAKMVIPLQSMREIDEREYHGQPTAEAVTDGKKKPSDSEKESKGPNRTDVDVSASGVVERGGELSLNDLIRQAAESPARKAHERDELPNFPDSAELLNNPDFLWWVFTSDGQKYGPAPGATLQKWISERRVGPNMQILRNGWNEPHEVREVFPEVVKFFVKNSPLDSQDWQESPSVSGIGIVANGGEASVSNRSENLTTYDSLAILKKRQKRAIGALYLIGFLTCVLLGVVGVLIWLLLK